MCVIHRVDSCGKRITVYEETAPGPVQRYRSANDSTGHNVRRESFTERLRRQEINRLSGVSHRSAGLELHQLSSQCSAIIEPIRFTSAWCEEKRCRKPSPHGRNDRYKTNRHQCTAIW